MASDATSRRRSRREREDSDEEEHEAPRRQKRRVTEEESEDSDGDDTSEQQENEQSSRTNGAAKPDFDEDGFQPGAIRRVKVENFVTYEKAEFFPGPNLNMVIGPNGTGKSSLVCAICLGLGYSPKHLGRAGSVKEFVKHGKATATIEIELQRRRQDRRNHVVQVQIDRERNSSRFRLNGKEATHKAIQSLMRDLSIQVDNLCQFLPQDRVVEFAGCTPVDLLHETLRAAADPQMLRWQTELQELHKDHKELQQRSGSHAETLANLENRQQAMQADVDRFREREEALVRIDDLGDARKIAHYLFLRTKYRETERAYKDARHLLQQLESESAPALEAVNSKQRYHAAVAAAVQARHAAVRAVDGAADRALNACENSQEEMAQCQAKIDAEKKVFDVKKRELGLIKTRIGQLERRLKNKPSDFDPKEWNQKIRAQEHSIRELEAEDRQIQTRIRDVQERGRRVRDEQNTLARDLSDLDTQEGQQLKVLEKHFPDVAAAWKWLRENGEEFQQEVFGPPMLCCNVKDKRYSDHIQAMLQLDDFMCFTAQTVDDHKKLSAQLYGKLGLSVSIRTCRSSFSSFNKLPAEEAQRMGFDCWAIDQLSGPEPVLAMLCNEKKLHLAGIGLKDVNETQYEALMQEDKVQNWATGNQLYAVKRRRDLKAVSNTTREIQPGRWWKDEVDLAEKQELQRRLDEVKQNMAVLREENTSTKKEAEENHAQRESILTVTEDLKEQKKVLQKEFSEYQAIPAKLEHEKKLGVKKQDELESCRAVIIDLEVQCDKAVLETARAGLKYQQNIANMHDAQQALIEGQIREIEARSDFEGLKDKNTTLVRRLDHEKMKIVEVEREKQTSKAEAKEAHEKVKEMCIQAADPTERQVYLTEMAAGKTLEDIDNEIKAESAKLELLHANPNAMRDYDKRAKDIEKIRREMEEAQSKSDQRMRQITRLREKWEPKLEELVRQINDAFAYNFEQINCGGEVRIHKDEDFDQWALDIMVKFRQSETLQKLDQHRQSGGERAVSTIFFLMALQSMARSPFRVVDEINQGMDLRNERMVHERMVEIACREHTSQYFLITPKLLTGLRYDERMRVLCIASGEHMPTEGKKLDFGRCLQIHKRSIGAAA
ncbi:hypothetical protein BN1708_003694 [Verticillium longisporum]|uniref:Structural maintenance of chromosomes protein 5 n=1 Tax=Verticillium longisporum TaxID=100787 RepID=A0A0G4LP02_VERLO|nr:hypothetical protein BN1708_003694 [Verticillium longisporum]